MFLALCGSATFAMLVFRTSQKAAKDTTNAISHGFDSGFDTEGGSTVLPEFGDVIAN
jgi:hypothetical protein